MRQFSEKQRFNQWWLWAIIISASFLPVIIETVEWLRGHDSAKQLIVSAIISLCVLGLNVVLLGSFSLKTSIDETGVSYQFYPIHLRPVKKTWDELEKVYIKHYRPLRDYGGWGMRYGMKNSMAYNISGDMGIQLVMKDGKKILLGTQHPVAAKDVLVELKNAGKISVDIYGGPEAT